MKNIICFLRAAEVVCAKVVGGLAGNQNQSDKPVTPPENSSLSGVRADRQASFRGAFAWRDHGCGVARSIAGDIFTDEYGNVIGTTWGGR